MLRHATHRRSTLSRLRRHRPGPHVSLRWLQRPRAPSRSKEKNMSATNTPKNRKKPLFYLHYVFFCGSFIRQPHMHQQRRRPSSRDARETPLRLGAWQRHRQGPTEGDTLSQLGGAYISRQHAHLGVVTSTDLQLSPPPVMETAAVKRLVRRCDLHLAKRNAFQRSSRWQGWGLGV